AGRLDTQLVERRLDELVRPEPVPDKVFAAAALDELLALQPTGPIVDPWDVPNGWRMGGTARTMFRLECGGQQVTVTVSGGAGSAFVSIGESDPVTASARWDGDLLVLTYAGVVTKFLRALDSDTLWLAADGHCWAVAEHSVLESTASTVE